MVLQHLNQLGLWAYHIHSRSYAAWVVTCETSSALAAHPSPEMGMALWNSLGQRSSSLFLPFQPMVGPWFYVHQSNRLQSIGLPGRWSTNLHDRLTGGKVYLHKPRGQLFAKASMPRGALVRLAVGGFLGSEQVQLGFPESNSNQLDHLGVESPFSRKGKLS